MNLVTAVEVDYENKSSYQITVNTDDGRGGKQSKGFTIFVNDLDEVILDIEPKNESDFQLYPNP